MDDQPNTEKSNGWNQNEKWILLRMSNVDEKVVALSSDISKLEDQNAKSREEIAALTVKAGLWGAIGGLIPIGVGLLGFLVQRLIP